ncbi:MAG: hypothetical protein ACRD15_16640 [Vicinamibacterales bacterium]
MLGRAPGRHAAIPAALVFAVATSAVHAQQPASAVLTGLSRDIACAPLAPRARPVTSMRIVGGTEPRQTQFSTGERVIVGSGTANGVRTGEEYVVRRIVGDRFTEPVAGAVPMSIHTAGTVQIIEAQTHYAVAVVTTGCDGISEGDYLERFAPPILPAGEIGTSPDFASPATLVLGAERRQIGAPGDFMILNRGGDHGLQAGQLLTVFRKAAGPSGPVTTIGTAKVYVVLPETATVRIEKSMDAVYVGDLVAVHR